MENTIANIRILDVVRLVHAVPEMDGRPVAKCD
jgi:hypothetical protein